jgi:hypothetical protein
LAGGEENEQTSGAPRRENDGAHLMDKHKRAETAAAARDYGNLFCIWRVCGNPGCLRAKRCCGEGLDCFRRCLPLLPAKVIGFFLGLSECQKAGLSWDEALEELSDEWTALSNWCVRVEDSLPAHAKRSLKRQA